MSRTSHSAATATAAVSAVVFLAVVAISGAAEAQVRGFEVVEKNGAATSACPGMAPAGSPVLPGDGRCGDRGSFEPLPASTISCLQSATRQHLSDLFQKGEIKAGAAVTTAQASLRMKTRPIAVRQYAWPVWVEKASSGKAPYAGCAGGATLPGEVLVSLREGEQRARTLVARETANNLLAWSLDRPELGDDAEIVDVAVNKALDACASLPYI